MHSAAARHIGRVRDRRGANRHDDLKPCALRVRELLKLGVAEVVVGTNHVAPDSYDRVHPADVAKDPGVHVGPNHSGAVQPVVACCWHCWCWCWCWCWHRNRLNLHRCRIGAPWSG